MTINLKIPDAMSDLQPRITVFGVGGAGGNAVNNMIQSGLEGVEFVVANTDAQALAMSSAERRIQMGTAITEGLGAGSQPQIGAAAAEEAMAEILDYVSGSHMVFITAGMGGGTGTGAAPVIARLARDQDILTIGVVTKPFQFEGARRMTIAELGIEELEKHVDTLIVIPNQNLFRVANERTTFADAFAMADQVLYSGVAGITDLMVKEGLINLDFADVRTIMNSMGKAMMGTGEACGENRAIEAAEAAIANPLLDDVSMKGARGLLISITGGEDLTLYEVDEAATRIRSEVDSDSNIILGATFDHALEGYIRVSVVATGIDGVAAKAGDPEVPQIEIGGKSGAESPFAQFNIASAQAPSQELEALAAPVGSEAHPMACGPDFDDDVGYATDGDDNVGVGEEFDSPRPAAHHLGSAQHDDEVTVRRVGASGGLARRSGASALQDTPPDQTGSSIDPSRPFIPPQAAELPQTGPRMPRVDEFPVIAQRAISAQDREPEDHGIEAQKRKTGFLERLANVGLGRRDAGVRPIEADEPHFGEPTMPAPDHGHEFDDPQGDAEATPARPPQQVATTLPASQRGVLVEEDGDDHLEIPAFLRRQAN